MPVLTWCRQLSDRYELTPLRWICCAGLFVAAFCLSTWLELGGTAGALVLFAGYFWLARREWRVPSPMHARVWGGIYAALLAAALTVGRLVRGTGDARGKPDVNYIDWEGKKDLLLFLPLALLLWLAFLQLRRVCAAHTLTGRAQRPRGRRCFVAAWALIFLCWTPYLLAFWPAGLVGDGAHTLEEALTPGVPAGNHWVVLYILTLRFFVWLAAVFGGGLSVGLCLYAVAQSLALAATCAAVVWQLYRLGVPRLLVAAAAAMYGLSGFFATYGMVTWKDTLFSAAVVLLALQLWSFAADGYRRGAALALAGTVLFLCFWRNNGLYVVVPTLVVLAIAFRKKAARLLAAGLAAVVLALAIQGPGYDALGIEKDALTESVSIPLQQMAAVIYEDRPLTEEQSEFLFALIPEETWKANYCPSLSDDLKSALDSRFLQDNLGEFLKVWAQLLPANLDVYIEAYLMQTTGFWQPGSWKGGYYEFFTGVDDIYSHGIHTVDWFEQWTGHGLMPVLSGLTRFVSSGTMVWIFLGGFFFCLAKPLGRRKNELLMLTPFLFCWLTLMISVPISHSYRYIFMLPLALPLFCLVFVRERTAGAAVQPGGKPSPAEDFVVK